VRKPGAMPGALATAQAREAGALTRAHEQFWARARRKFGDAGGTRALIEVLLLHRGLPFPAVHAALEVVNAAGSADPALVAIEARRITEHRGPTGSTVPSAGHLRRFDRDAPVLSVFDFTEMVGAYTVTDPEATPAWASASALVGSVISPSYPAASSSHDPVRPTPNWSAGHMHAPPDLRSAHPHAQPCSLAGHV
jgi:hypothetical protein